MPLSAWVFASAVCFKTAEENVNSDDHFDRPFSFMAMEGKHENERKSQQQQSSFDKKGTTMNSLTQFKKISIPPLLIALALALRAGPAAAQANEVTHWNEIAMSTIMALPPAAGFGPALQVNMAMTQGAVYDALNAIEPRYQPYLLQTRFDSSASKEAATARAAYRMLSNIVSTVPENIVFDRATLLERLTTEYNNSLNGIPPGPRDAGIAAGNAAADAMIAARHGEDFCPCADGRFGPSPWVPNYEPGHWQPLLDPNGTPILDPVAWVANVRPFLIQSPSQFRTDGPNALTSTAYAEDFNEVKALGSMNSTTRTPEQTHIAIFWVGAGGALWNAVARNLIADPQYAVDIVDSALLFAMQNLSAADSVINCWNDKYYWDFWRPWTAIQRADEDGNPDTEPDPSWTSLVTAPYPEHPSGHLSLDGAHLEALKMFFGTNQIPFGVTSLRFPGETRYFHRFSDALNEIVDARILAGLHFRTADVQGRILGRQVAHYMARHYFQPVQ
jgi:PAP2 superfamily